jgi:hypothetical protein
MFFALGAHIHHTVGAEADDDGPRERVPDETKDVV